MRTAKETTLSFDSLADELFYAALRIRLVEERIAALYPTNQIQSPVHLSLGQEAVAVGVCHPLQQKDLLFAHYRSHAFYLAKGGDLKAMFAELFGKKTGCAGGKGGSMHLFSADQGMLLSSAVVASTISHAVGAALAAKARGTGGITVAVFGDGATEEGVFHESLNFAALRKLPIVFLCENNELAIHSRIETRQAYRILDLPRVYGIESVRLSEGYDPLKVRQAFVACVEKARWRSEPQFLEVRTFRYREHVGVGEDFGAGYRSSEEAMEWRKLDPLLGDRERVAKFGPVIEREIDDAVHFAEASPRPGSDELLTNVI